MSLLRHGVWFIAVLVSMLLKLLEHAQIFHTFYTFLNFLFMKYLKRKQHLKNQFQVLYGWTHYLLCVFTCIRLNPTDISYDQIHYLYWTLSSQLYSFLFSCTWLLFSQSRFHPSPLPRRDPLFLFCQNSWPSPIQMTQEQPAPIPLHSCCPHFLFYHSYLNRQIGDKLDGMNHMHYCMLLLQMHCCQGSLHLWKNFQSIYRPLLIVHESLMSLCGSIFSRLLEIPLIFSRFVVNTSACMWILLFADGCLYTSTKGI